MKFINFILGAATAIIVSGLVVLGIRAFYPEPAAPDYSKIVPMAAPYPDCLKDDAQCIAKRNAQIDAQNAAQEDLRKQQEAYDVSIGEYNRNVFIIANLAGLVVFILGFLLLFLSAVATRSIPLGVMLAGLYGVLYGYGRGWASVDDRLKFFVGLAVAIVMIGGSMWLAERYYRKINPKP